MATITQENVKFNGTLDDAIVLRDVNNVRTLVLTDKLSAADLSRLEAFVDKYGSNPLAAPTAGRSVVSFPANPVAGTSTGLNTSAATAGRAIIRTTSGVSRGTSSFLETRAGSRGRQTINFNVLNEDNETSAVVGSAPRAGRQRVALNLNGILYANNPGFPNTTALFQAEVTFDGGAPILLAIQGEDAQTYTALFAYIETAIGAAGSLDVYTTDGRTYIEFVSATTGTSSSVEIVDNNLFSTLTGYSTIEPPVAGTATTLANFTLLVSINGAAPQTLSISNSSFGSPTDLASAINDVITGAEAFPTQNGRAVTIQSTTEGNTSSVRVTGGTVFDRVPGMYAAFPLKGTSKIARTYNAVIIVNGVSYSVNFPGVGATTYGDVIDAINADLGGAATASIVDSQLVITSATTGVNSTVRILDAGGLFGSLQAYEGISYVDGTAARTYTATVSVDGTPVQISIPGSAAATFGALITEINADLGSVATAALSGGDIVITSATTGTSSSVAVVRDDLFRFVSGFAGIERVDGITDLVTAMNQQRVGSGSLYDLYEVVQVGDKPALPPVPAVLPKTDAFTYFGGTPPAWRYLEDDTEV